MDKKIKKVIEKAVKEITKINKDPLDGDETEEIACLFHVELDYNSGNLTEEEYEKRLKLIEAL